MLHRTFSSFSGSDLSMGLLRNEDGTEGSGQWWPPRSPFCQSPQNARKWKFRQKSNLAPQCLERSGEVKMQTRLLWTYGRGWSLEENASAVGENSKGTVADGCSGPPQTISNIFLAVKKVFWNKRFFIWISGGEAAHNLGCEKENSRATGGIKESKVNKWIKFLIVRSNAGSPPPNAADARGFDPGQQAHPRLLQPPWPPRQALRHPQVCGNQK